MLINLLLGLAVMVLCLLVQALLVVVVIELYVRNRDRSLAPTFARTLSKISVVMLVLVTGNCIQIAIWAQLFVTLGEFSDFSTALYHSAVNFATLGYGDIVMSEHRRILGPMEALNGILMVGVSTAVMMSALQYTLKMTYQARRRG